MLNHLIKKIIERIFRIFNSQKDNFKKVSKIQAESKDPCNVEDLNKKSFHINLESSFKTNTNKIKPSENIYKEVIQHVFMLLALLFSIWVITGFEWIQECYEDEEWISLWRCLGFVLIFWLVFIVKDTFLLIKYWLLVCKIYVSTILTFIVSCFNIAVISFFKYMQLHYNISQKDLTSYITLSCILFCVFILLIDIIADLKRIKILRCYVYFKRRYPKIFYVIYKLLK